MNNLAVKKKNAGEWLANIIYFNPGRYGEIWGRLDDAGRREVWVEYKKILNKWLALPGATAVQIEFGDIDRAVDDLIAAIKDCA